MFFFFARMCFIHLTVNSRKADQKYSYYLFALIIFLIYKIFYVKLISRQNKHYYGCYSSMYQFRARILLLREISCFSNDCDFPGLNRSSMAGLAGWLAGKVNMINDWSGWRMTAWKNVIFVWNNGPRISILYSKWSTYLGCDQWKICAVMAQN